MKVIRKYVAWLLAVAICIPLVGCSFEAESNSVNRQYYKTDSSIDTETLYVPQRNHETEITELSTTESRYQVMELVLDDLEEMFGDEFTVDYISAQYHSQEYIDELEYNSLSNDYFGYDYATICEAMSGKVWSFTAQDGETVVTETPPQSDVLAQMVKDVAVGAGVIIICVVVSYISAGVGTTPVACFFAGSAKGAALGAIKGGATGAVIGGVIEGIKTQSWEGALDGAISGFGTGFKFGAICGAITGGLTSDQCFTGDTFVKTENDMIPIDQIVVGDKVLSFNESNDTMEYATVSEVFTNEVNELFVITTENDTIETTASHPFLTASGWERANQLAAGDKLICENGTVQIQKIEAKQQTCTVYNLTVEGTNTYTVGSDHIVVHNACGDSAKLRNNMCDAGDVPPNYSNAAHHIVPSSDSRFPQATQSRKILEKFGIDINSANNGVFLSTDKAIAGTTYHRSLHTAEYYDKVLMYLQNASSKQEALDALAMIKEALLNGTFI